jgi:hypothetical protein
VDGVGKPEEQPHHVQPQVLPLRRDRRTISRSGGSRLATGGVARKLSLHPVELAESKECCVDIDENPENPEDAGYLHTSSFKVSITQSELIQPHKIPQNTT